MDGPFIHLQVISSCAYLSAASSPEALVSAATAQGMTTLALTDVANPYGAPRFHRAAEAGIRPLHGVEVTTTTGDALVLLVRDATGWTNLCRLCTTANFAGTKGKPQLDPSLLGQFAEGLTALLAAARSCDDAPDGGRRRWAHGPHSTHTARAYGEQPSISPSPTTVRRMMRCAMQRWRRGRASRARDWW